MNISQLRPDDEMPAELRAAIERDLHPVAPLPSPSTRVLPLVPVAIVLLVASAAAFGLRVDAPDLGPLLTWGASVGQMALGLLVMAAALREAVPGTTLTRRAIGVIAGTALIALLAITWATWWTSPTMIRPDIVGYVWRICVAGTVLSALPALMLSGWLVARAFPLRPRVAGALYGLGAGLLADAGWRLFCHFSDPAHVLGAHALGVGLAAMIGAAAASVKRRAEVRR
jgi:hypothetical protein